MGFSEKLNSRSFNLQFFEDACHDGVIQKFLRDTDSPQIPKTLDAQGLQDIVCRGLIEDESGRKVEFFTGQYPKAAPYASETNPYIVTHTLVDWKKVNKDLNNVDAFLMQRNTKIKQVIDSLPRLTPWNIYRRFFGDYGGAPIRDPSAMGDKEKKEHEESLRINQIIRNWSRQERESTQDRTFVQARTDLRKYYLNKFGWPYEKEDIESIEKSIRDLANNVKEQFKDKTIDFNQQKFLVKSEKIYKDLLDMAKDQLDFDWRLLSLSEPINDSVLRNSIRNIILECYS